MQTFKNSELRYRLLFETARDGILILNAGTGLIADVNPCLVKMLGYTRKELVEKKFWEVSAFKNFKADQDALEELQKDESIHLEDFPLQAKDGRLIDVEFVSNVYSIGDEKVIQCIIRDITSRKQSEQSLRESEERFRTTLEEMLEGCQIIGFDWRYLFINDSAIRHSKQKKEDLLGHTMMECYPDIEKTDMFTVLRRCMNERTSDFLVNEFIYPDGSKGWFELNIQPVPDGIFILSNDVTRHKLAEARIQRQLDYHTTLIAIGQVIRSNFDLDFSLTAILAQLITQLQVDAASVLFFDPLSMMLEYAATQGFRTKNLEHLKLPLLDCYAGRVVLNNQMAVIPNINDQPVTVFQSTLLAGEDFVSYYGIPLISNGQIRGVLEIFHRLPLKLDKESLNFMEAIAGQIAIAYDHVTLFTSLQSSNAQLLQSYDATIEGWARALDLRDKETEGHSRRVTEMTVKVARALGMSEEKLVQIRWGALLHDIGKMGIPDSILLKPDSLNEDEWELMKKHPSYAYELLLPISYLQAALDIPYCHHEKWDGTGYPRGLAGEQIPLSARIFAVVDVWDALRSDRPYRAAWPAIKAREHIRSLAGIHFDPEVVKSCFKLRLFYEE